MYKIYSEESGNLIESGEMIDGLKEGVWTLYHDSLQIALVTSEYTDGKLNGDVIQYHENGAIHVRSAYLNDLSHGMTTWFDEYETKNSEVNFSNGLKEGTQYFWNGSGVATKKEVYENGELVETK